MTDIRDEDLLIETYQPHPVGGQQVGRTSAGVRITHRPTGIGVVVTSERSQHANRTKALAKLVELLSVDIVERVERETAEAIATWLASRDAGPDPRSRPSLAENIRANAWRKGPR